MSKLRKAARIASRVPGGVRAVAETAEELAQAVEGAARIYKRFHWGDQPRDLELASAPSLEDGDVLVVLGDLHEVEYTTTKGGEDAIWCHEFSEPKPQLCMTKDGQLVIVGGRYRVTEKGIVG